MKKFRLTDEAITTVSGIVLHRIEATFDIPKRSVCAGDKGGYLESEYNLDGNAWVYGDAKVYGDARVYGNAEVYGDAKVYGNAEVYGNAKVYGDAWVSGDAKVSGNAWIIHRRDIVWLSVFGSRSDTTTAYRTKDYALEITCGCFRGSLEDFAAAVKKRHGNTQFGREYKAIIGLLKIRFNEKKR